jgi:hypothetical protein
MQEEVQRREFLARMGSALGCVGAGSRMGQFGLPADARAEDSAEVAKRRPTTTEIQAYLLQNSPWVKGNNTVDTVKCGDPERPVKKAGVAWFPSIWDIRAAIRAGCDLLIVHEPTFWEHSAAERQWRDRGPGIAKSTALRESGLVILRAHDTWDNWPEIGIRDSWAKYLGLTTRIREGSSLRWTAVYEIPETTLRDFAQQVADRIRALGEDSVQVIGDAEQRCAVRPWG